MKNDNYSTPVTAVEPLVNHLNGLRLSYYEPCVGDGALVGAFANRGFYCAGRSDKELDATVVDYKLPPTVSHFITNPPWTREILHPLIMNLCQQKPTWLLFDADWMHTKQAIPYLTNCKKIVSVGRVKWISGSPYVGKDNVCWYYFDNCCTVNSGPIFYGR